MLFNKQINIIYFKENVRYMVKNGENYSTVVKCIENRSDKNGIGVSENFADIEK